MNKCNFVFSEAFNPDNGCEIGEITLFGGAENAGHENAGPEIDGPMCGA